MLIFLCALQAPASADFPELPELRVTQTLTAAESSPRPGTIVSSLFGEQITRHNATALIWIPNFPALPDQQPEQVGRVAVFRRDSHGLWVRDGSIDPPQGNVRFGANMAVFNDFALIESATHAFFYHRIQGKWKLMQILTAPSGSSLGSPTIWNNWAFIGTRGGVYVYQITSANTLKGVQTLRSYSGDPADRFGEHVVVSNGRVLVSARGDSGHRGAAYVFELSGSLFVKRQKLVAIDGTSSDGFASQVGISGDWIAIGAPAVPGPADPDCNALGSDGAIYVFHRVNGKWLQQDTLRSGDARSQNFPCINELGARLMISGPWIASTIHLPADPGETREIMLYKRDDAGHYVPSATVSDSDMPQISLYLSDGILFVGVPFTHGCQFEACTGWVDVHELDKAGL